MASKAVYQLSAKQIFIIAIMTGVVAVAATAVLFTLQRAWTADPSNTAFAEEPGIPAGISDPNTVSDEQNSIEVYKTMAPGVAFINTTSVREGIFGPEQGRGNGSGSVIDTEGHILTNYHVVENPTRLSVSFGGETSYPATYVGGDPDTDLAVIKIDPPASGLTVVPFGDSDKLVVGQKVLAIGNPFGLDRTLTTGVISGLQRPIRGRNNRPIDAAIQTDASINPGNSGGPLLDKFGRMIGINSQILSPAGGSVGVGFAVPANTAKRVVPQLIQFGEVRRPKLGASLPSIMSLRQQGYRLPVENGLLVVQVQPGTPAAAAGLKGLDADGTIFDIIISADGQPMNDMDDLYRLLDKKQFNDTVQLQVFRNGETRNVAVKLTPLPSSGATRRRARSE